MLLTDSIRQMYSLDILDPRFVSSAPSPSDPSVRPRAGALRRSVADRDSENGSSAREESRALPQGANPSRWGTPEYWLYYFLFFGALGWMFKVAMDVSKGSRYSSSLPRNQRLTRFLRGPSAVLEILRPPAAGLDRWAQSRTSTILIAPHKSPRVATGGCNGSGTEPSHRTIQTYNTNPSATDCHTCLPSSSSTLSFARSTITSIRCRTSHQGVS